MARKAKYTAALPVYVTPAVRAEILKIADEREVSQAEVVRELIDRGLWQLEEAETPVVPMRGTSTIRG